MTTPADPLDLFHPLIAAWFRGKTGIPTDIQACAWPLIAEGRHVLLTAPTGSGKTLTAFLWALNRFATDAASAGSGTRILYVSPLKALNNDIQRNLMAPLEALRAEFAAAGSAFPEVRVLVRSGDTPASERRRMLRNPPEILITTPESLNLMLLTDAGRASLRTVETVILDEVHAVAGSKRGTHLITGIDRMVPLAGEFQRIALSATVRPLETVAAWIGGYILGETGYVPRPVSIAVSRAPKLYHVRVRYPSRAESGAFGTPPPEREGAAPGRIPGDNDVWTAMAKEIRDRLQGARSTLVFANNRRMSERMARLLNEGSDKPVAYAHHGSLSREIRSLVEERMKAGQLPAIVATNSLELGIDIGALDQVILVQTPFSIASALQKIGRAGHGVGQTSRALLFASHGKDLLDAATAVGCVLAGDLEETRVIEGPLDLLAQILVSLAASEAWTADRMFAFIRTSHPYRHLSRGQFDVVLEMLAGRFEASRVRELRPRVFIDAVDGRVTAAKGAVMLVGLSGGTIPDRGLYALRHANSRAKIGELDEEFVWERREGELFHLGSQSWRITRITANEMEVVPADRPAQMAPFWRADERDRGFHFSDRLGSLLERAERDLDDPAFAASLITDHGLETDGAEALVEFLRRQRAATNAPLPHRHHLLLEEAGESEGGEEAGEGVQIIVHAIWGGRLLRPWAYAMAQAFEASRGRPLEIITSDDCLLVRLPPDMEPSALLELVHPDNLEGLLRKRLEHTGYFAAHFRENAARALLLPRSTPRARVPLWLNRLRSRNLLQAVSAFPDFPVALETWRECLRDEFDLPNLKAMLAEVHAGTIRVSQARSSEPSPFADHLMWKKTNKWMYEGDRPAAGPGANADLLREIAFSAPLRPRIPRAVIREFEAKSLRLAPGYAPQGANELVEWVKERVLLPREECRELLGRMEIPPDAAVEFRSHAEARLVSVRLPGAQLAAVIAVETLPRLLTALGTVRDDVVLTSALPLETLVSLSARAADAATPDDRPASEAVLAHLARFSAAPSPADPESEPPLAPLISQWLRAYGPVTGEFPRRLFGRAFPRVEEALSELGEGDRLVADVLSEDATGPEICDAANLETLLRIMRRRARPEFRALAAERLPQFLAAWQGLANPARDAEGLQAALEKLFGYPAAAAAWETDILPARVAQYLPSRLDEAMRDTGLLWCGRGDERIAFAFPEDLELFPFLNEGADAKADLKTDANAGTQPALGHEAALVLNLLAAAAPGRVDFQALAARCPLPSDRLTAALWELAWRGRITNDTFAALRKGIETGFRPAAAPDANAGRGDRERMGSRRQGFQRWKAARPMAGAWSILPTGEADTDALELEDLAQDRVRQLLRRYGVLFRELLNHEAPALQWAAVFRSLRLLELSGEVLSGHFFEGIPGLQFLAPNALRMLESGLPDGAVVWMSATDPASPCALGLQRLPYDLPPRLASTWLVFHGSELVVTARRLGRDLAIRVPPRHKYLAGYLAALRTPVERAFLPVKALETETINGEPATESPYLEDLLEAGFEKGFKTLGLRKRF